jgi:hypothetical protein
MWRRLGRRFCPADGGAEQITDVCTEHEPEPDAEPVSDRNSW